MTVSSARYNDLYDYCRTAEQIDYDLMGRADQLSSRLSYFEATCRESRFRLGGDGLGGALRSYAAHALPIDQFVRAVGQAFQRADAAWGAAGPGGWWNAGRELTGELSNWWAWLAALAPVPALIAMSWRPGVGYVGKTIFSGPSWARDILGLSPRLSHISNANLLTHIGKNARNVGPWFLLGATITSAEQWLKDVKEYRQDPLRMITAMTIDTEVIVATLGVSAIVAVKVAAVVVAGLGIGGTVGPLLVVGAVAVGIGLLAEKFLLEPFLESEFRQDVIDGVTDKGTKLLEFLDGRVGALIGSITSATLSGATGTQGTTSTPETETVLPDQTAIKTEPTIPHLSQRHPQGSELLSYKRYEYPPGSPDKTSEPHILTVEDHIEALGCLMTDYTMLLRGRGYDTDVTDLYEAAVHVKGGQIDHTDKSVVLFDLDTGPEIVNPHLEKKYNVHVVQEYLPSPGNIESVKDQVQAHGPLILHVTGTPGDGHWIVVRSNDAGSLVVLDPLESEPTTLDQYTLFGDGVFQVLVDKPAKAT